MDPPSHAYAWAATASSPLPFGEYPSAPVREDRKKKKNGGWVGDEELLSLRMGAWGFPCPLSSAHPNLVLPPQPEADDEVVGGHKMSEPVIG